MMITYKELSDAHYIKVNGEVDCHNSHLLWEELSKLRIIPEKKIIYHDGLIEILRGLSRKYLKGKNNVNSSKKVILDFSETDLRSISGVAITIEVYLKRKDNLEVIVGNESQNTFSLTRSDYFLNLTTKA